MPPKPVLALPHTLQVTLCSNRDPHPGITEKDRKPRRTSEQVAAEKEQKLQEKLGKAQRKEETIRNAAHLEDTMEEEDQLRLLKANHPPPNKQKKAACSQRPTQAGTEEDPPTDDDMYVPLDKDLEDGEDEVFDKSDDDDAPRAKKKTKGDLRKQVEAARTPVAPSADGNKRKAAESPEPLTSETTRKKPKKMNDGLRNDWNAKSTSDDKEDHLLTETHPSHRRSVSGSSGLSISNLPGDLPPNSGGEGSDVDEMGGVSDDAGELVEQRGLAEKSKASLQYGMKSKVKPLAKIVPTMSVPNFVSPSPGSRLQFKKKEDVRLSDLPPDLQHNFDTVFSPQLCEYLGHSETPWDPPTKTAIIELWKQAFPTIPLRDDGFLYHVVTKLIDDRVSSWRNKFAKGAIEYLSKILFPQLPENTKEHRAVWCTWAISGSNRQQPYYYLAYDDAEEESGGIPVTKGIFQSAIISAVLGAHFSSIPRISSALRTTNKPVGALVLTIQAVKRAIGFYITGDEYKSPRPLSDFSKDNWGDQIRHEEGKEEKIKTTSSIVKVVLKLSDKQWEKIIRAAVSSSKPKRATLSVPAPVTAASDSESDFELADDDEDLLEDQ